MKKLKNRLLSLILLASSLHVIGQQSLICKGVETPTSVSVYNVGCPTPTSTAWLNKYSKQGTYSPTPVPSTALITLKIVLHIFTYDNGTAAPGLWESNPSAVGNPTLLNSYLSPMINDTKDRYSAARSATYPYTLNTTYVNDSRIRYEVSNIYYYPSTPLYTNTASSNHFNYIQTNFPGRLDEGMPILICNNGWGQQGYGNGANAVLTSITYYNNVSFRNHLLHEIGHCFGLGHTYQDYSIPTCYNGGADWTVYGGACGNPDYLDDVFPAGQPTCAVKGGTGCPYTITISPPTSTCGSCYELADNSYTIASNNLMGGTAPDWTSPLQMGRRIRIMRLVLNGNGMRKYAKDVPSDHINTWNITANETWDFDIQMYEDIIVKAGNTLIVKCKIAMPKEGKIIVEKGAKLVVDGGEITTWSKSGFWTGIEIAGTSTQNQSLSGGYGVYQGYVNVINSATISNADCAINTGTTNASGSFDWSSTGGIIIANTANFINNRKDVQFMYYHSPSGGNLSSFNYCNFKTNNVLLANALPDSRVSLYEVDAVPFRGCSFEYNAGVVYSTGNRGNGINSIDASYTIDQQGTTKTQFLNFTNGVYVNNSNPLRVVSIKNTNFYDVIGYSTYYNTITTPIFEYNYVRTAGNGNGFGLYLNNCNLYNINNNTFLQNAAITGPVDRGIYATNSQAGAHKIYRNSFANLYVAIGAIDNNSGVSNTTDGLKMNCNDFTPIANFYDVALMASSSTIAPTVMQNQGISTTAQTLVRNKYGALSASSSGENKWYIQGTSVKTINHPANSDANMLPIPQPANSDVSLNVTSSGGTYNSINCPATESAGGGGGGARLTNINMAISNLQSQSTFAKGSNPNTKADFNLQVAVAEKLNYFLVDSQPESRDSVIALLQNYPNVIENADVLLTFAHINKGDFTKAQQNANALAVTKTDWANLQTKLISLHQSPNKAFSINTNLTAKAVIENHANTDGKAGRGAAQSILKFVNNQNYYIPHLLPLIEGNNIKSMQNPLVITNDDLQNADFNVYPNPATNLVNFVYKGNNSNAHITLANTMGTIVYQTDVKPNTKTEISLVNLETGLYLLTAYNGKTKVYQTKVMCIK